MNDLYNDIFERWVKAIDETDTIASHKEKVSERKYASSFRYDLNYYEQSNFPAGGQLLDQDPAEELSYHKYGLDNNGRPVYVFFEHSWNKVSWEGVYNYSDNQVEYLEFCVNNKVPSGVQVVKYENNRKISYQHLTLTEGGRHYSLSKDEKEAFVESIKNDEYAIKSYVEKYLYEDERIIKTECLRISPGIEQLRFEKKYTYNNQGELAEIRVFYPSGITQLAYVKPE